MAMTLNVRRKQYYFAIEESWKIIYNILWNYNRVYQLYIIAASSFFSIRFVSVYVVHSYSSIDTAKALKKFCFISSERSDFHMIDNLSIIVHAFVMRTLTSLSVDQTLLSRYVSWNLRWLYLVHIAQYPLLLAPGYLVGIRLGQVYLQEALDHLHCLHQL